IMLKLSAPGTVVAGEAAQQDSAGLPANTIISPSQRGLILIRRLAPTVAEYESVSRISEGDMCAPVTVLAGSLRAQEE
ncbi:MAG: hypothetical protein MRY64_10140, partial [Hyphomonadaceae bacterium]|nr:hypothetical protein [Hyphomonadaceae bacterium]